MRLSPYIAFDRRGGYAGEPPHFMVGVNVEPKNGWGLGLFVRKNRRGLDTSLPLTGKELFAVSLWIGRGDLLICADRRPGRRLPRFTAQWTWLGQLRPRPA